MKESIPQMNFLETCYAHKCLKLMLRDNLNEFLVIRKTVFNLYINVPSFKDLFDFEDFDDNGFLPELDKFHKFYDNVIDLEYKYQKENLAHPYETLSGVVQNIREDSINLAI
jgi:hypothetical protein